MKKTITLLVALSLILGLCACGKKPSKTDETPTTTSTQIPTEAPATEATTEATTVATKAPTKAPTTAATTAPTAAATVAATTAPAAPVKTVIDSTYPHENAGDSLIQQHTLKCPALTANTPAAQNINKKIYDIYAKAISQIEGDTPVEWICMYDYSYAEYNGVIALVLNLTAAYIQSEYFTVYETYYYDSNTGKELTYEEYLTALELSDSQLLAAFNAVSDMANSPVIYGYKITGAAVGKEETKLVVFYQHDMGDMYTIATVKTSTLK